MQNPFSQLPSPCFVIEEEKLRNNLKLIERVKKEAGVEIIPAFKGFSMWSVFPILREYVSGASASSLHEARLCFEEMKVRAHTYCPAFLPSDFREILGYSSHIVFNSIAQFETHIEEIRRHPEKISVGLRVNPEFSEVEPLIYNACSPGSRLGILAEALPERLPAEVEGLHFHTLCESGADDLQKTLEAFESRFGKYIPQVKWVNMGGGHLITRKGYDVELLIRLLRDFRKRWPVHVILEPGSAFAWETGVLISEVLDVVENRGIKTAMLNVSFAAHMPDCLEMPYKPRITGSWYDPVPGKPTYRMGGNSCLSGDYVGEWSFDEELHPGDRIIFEDMIHYTMVKTNFFNGVKHPSIGILHCNGRFEMVREFSYEEYKNKLS
ncbi:MAG: carboxynorspermidine decarboxylase [Bacteroidota bacterium]|jgi:carboxynorspermidine decarboxylase|nr:carboxynorspermidine decarboxylase [Bacteroidota bacterium]NLT00020.1 carboxynorspermidine decarboxylase [Bacteroidales bacterium]OQB81589.1 MAG: Carboxynorspermidine/carboxyspermidine decarboxylase [Bacteroidetes bacterium ADurb.Bin123]